MKILLVANTGWNLYNFRRNLAQELQSQGIEVGLVCPADRYAVMLEAAGFRWLPWHVSRSGVNPFRELASLRNLAAIYRREQPQLVHHFTIKCIVYGTLAARWSGVRRVVNTVTGLGHVYLSDSPAMRLLRPLVHRWYSWSLSAHGVRTMFQNRDDLNVLAARIPHLARRAVLCNGSGVDLKRFSPGPAAVVPDPQRPPVVLFAGRLIAQKGIHEYVASARQLKERGLNARFLVSGKTDPGNPSSVSEAQCAEWRREGVVELLGHVDRIEDVLRDADVVVLPSYREGTPRVLLEAAAMAKPIVATDVPGCREVVVDGLTGRLVPAGDADALADTLMELLGDHRLRTQMGRAGRKRVVEVFDERRVIRTTFDVYAELLGSDRLSNAALGLRPAAPTAAAPPAEFSELAG